MSSPYTTLGLPPDGVAWAALAAACVLVPIMRMRQSGASRRGLLPALALGASLLSFGYIAHYLRGGPRIIDATSYYLQARAMAHGYFSFPLLAPSGSFRGRFLLAPGDHSLAVIFPPGYAALLAAGFLIHAPMAVGPFLAALIVLCTYALAREVSGRSDVALLAAGLSVVCAALRYHTADTMSHGLSGLLLCGTTWLALRARRSDALLCGLGCGWLLATRPITGLVALVLSASLLVRSPRRALCFALGLIPGTLLLLCYQRATTGSFWGSTQLAYYALADGPPGCFRYGFGPRIGCLFEHGEYVRARLPNGYGPSQALRVTLRRLAVHSIDIANAAPLALLIPAGAWLGRKARGVPTIFFGCLGLVLAYAPFYFDASYPGGGARLFADLLPLEHVLLALAVVHLRLRAFALPLSLAGFALHASFSHRALAEREGGRPMFETEVLTRAHVTHGLIFVDTDHGFNLGHDPGQANAQRGLVIARYEHDAHDLVLWNRLGRPASYRYSYQPSASDGHPELLPYTPDAARFRTEAESEWPPLAVRGGWAQPDFFPCASSGRSLHLQPSSSPAGMSVDFELLAPDSSPHTLYLGWIRAAGPPTTLTLRPGTADVVPGPAEEQGLMPGAASLQVAGGAPACLELDFGLVTVPGGAQRFRLTASRLGMLDYVEVRP